MAETQPEAIIEDDLLPMKSLFRIDEVARYFDVSERCIRLWIEHGILTAEQYCGNGVIRVTRDSILTCRFRSRIKKS